MMIVTRLTLVLLALVKIHREASLPDLHTTGLQRAPDDLTKITATSESFMTSSEYILSGNRFSVNNHKNFIDNWINGQKTINLFVLFSDVKIENCTDYGAGVYKHDDRISLSQLQGSKETCVGTRWCNPKYFSTWRGKKVREASFKQKIRNLIGFVIRELPQINFELLINVVQLTLILSNDVETNPGPNNPDNNQGVSATGYRGGAARENLPRGSNNRRPGRRASHRGPTRSGGFHPGAPRGGRQGGFSPQRGYFNRGTHFLPVGRIENRGGYDPWGRGAPRNCEYIRPAFPPRAGQGYIQGRGNTKRSRGENIPHGRGASSASPGHVETSHVVQPHIKVPQTSDNISAVIGLKRMSSDEQQGPNIKRSRCDDQPVAEPCQPRKIFNTETRDDAPPQTSSSLHVTSMQQQEANGGNDTSSQLSQETRECLPAHGSAPSIEAVPSCSEMPANAPDILPVPPNEGNHGCESKLQLTLILSNDVETNPGPNNPDNNQPSTSYHSTKQSSSSSLQQNEPSHSNVQPITNDSTIHQSQAGNQTHKRGGGSQRAHGDFYHLLLTMLLIVSAHVQGLQFEIAIEFEPAGKFDDIFLKYQNNEGIWEDCFFQVKHYKDDSTGLAICDFLSIPNKKDKKCNNKLKLHTFIESFLKLKNLASNPIPVLFTNKKIEFGGNIDDFIFTKSVFERINFPVHTKVSFLKFCQSFPGQDSLCSHILSELVGGNCNQQQVEEFINCLHIAAGQMSTDEMKEEIENCILKITRGNKLTVSSIWDKLYAFVSKWFTRGSGTFKTQQDIKIFVNQVTNDPSISYHHQLRSPHEEFTGRSKELKCLQETEIKIIYISGKSGVGKTQLVLKYLHDNIDSFTHIIWINAITKQNILDAFLKVAIIFGVVASEEKCEISEIRSRVYGFFKKSDQCIFIFDGADDNVYDIREYIPEYNLKAAVKYIVTTQDLKKHTLIELQGFSEAESYKFLTPNLKDFHYEDHAKELTKEIGYFPLALQCIKSLIKHKNELCETVGEAYTTSHFLQEFLETKKDVLQTYGPMLNMNELILYVIWQLCINLLIENEKKSAIDILQLMAFIEPFEIPSHIFLSITKNKRDLQHCLHLLQKLSLIQNDRGVCSIHEMIQKTIQCNLVHNNKTSTVIQTGLKILTENSKKTLRWEEKNFPDGIIQHVISLWIHFIKLDIKHEKHEDFNTIPQYILNDLNVDYKLETCRDFARISMDHLQKDDCNALKVLQIQTQESFCHSNDGNYSEGLNTIKIVMQRLQTIENGYPLLAQVKFVLADALKKSGDFEAALDIYNEVLDMDTRQFGLDHLVSLLTRGNKAEVLWIMGRMSKDLCQYEQILSIRKEKLGNDHPSTFTTTKKRAWVLNDLGRYNEAFNEFDIILRIQKLKFGDDHPKTLSTMQNKASVLISMGRYHEAFSQCEHVLSIQKVKLGDDHPITLSTMHNKASVLNSMGRYDEALSQYEHVLSIRKVKLGDDHPDTLTTMNNKALLLLDNMGRYDEALSQYEHVLRIQKEKLGDDHPKTLTTMNNKASVLDSMGRYDEALSQYEHVLSIQKVKLGDDHPNTLSTMHNKASVLNSMGRYDEALSQYEHVLSIRKVKLGDDHPNTLTTMNNKASLLDNMGRYDEALSQYEHVLSIRKEKLGDDHPDNLTIMHNKASMLNSMGRYDEALSQCEHVLSIQKVKLGDDHPNTLSTMHNKASVLNSMGRYDEALSQYEHVLSIRKVKLGDDHPNTLTTMNNKASLLDNMGRYDEALSQYEHVLSVSKEKLGDDHPDTLSTMHNKASVLDSMGRYDEALSQYEHVLSVSKEKLGDDHPDTLTTMHSKASVLKSMGKYDEALSQYEHVLSIQKVKLGDDHPDTLTTMNNKASLLDNMGRYDEALSQYVHVLRIQKEKLGDDHPNTLTTMHNKASVLDSMGRYDEALSQYEHVLSVQKVKLGDDHPDTLTTMHSKASVLNSMGRYDEALSQYEHVLRIQKEKLGDDHPKTMTTMHNKASVLGSMGRYDEALSQYEHVLSISKEKFGDDHPNTLMIMHNKASVLKTIGRYDEALSQYEHVLSISKEKLGDDHPNTLSTMHNKASVLKSMGRYDEALSQYEHVLSVQKVKLGDDHPDTLTTMHNKASVLKCMRRNDEALSQYEHVLSISKEKFGDDHPNTLTIMNNKNALLKKQGKYEDAVTIFKHVYKKRVQKIGLEHPHTRSTLEFITELDPDYTTA